MNNAEFQEWLAQVASKLSIDKDHALDELVAGRLHMLGRIGEQSQLLHDELRGSSRIGVAVMTGEEDDAPEIAANFVRSLQDAGLDEPVSVEARTFDVGIGAGGVVVVVTVLVGIVTILANAPKAAANVKAWATAIRSALGSTEAEALTMETLKLICIDNVIDEHKGAILEPELISSSMCVTQNPETDEEVLHGPAYIIIPAPYVSLTYVFTITWSGEILHRIAMPYAGPSPEELTELREIRALRSTSE